MHHIFLRCGWRAFFFKCLAHSLVGERVDVGQFDHALRQQAQRPAGAFVGRRRAGQRDQVRLLRAVELALVEARSRAVGSQGRLQALLDKALTQALDGGDTRVKGVRDARVRPAGPAFGLIRLEQHLGVLETAHIRLAPGQQTVKLLTLLSGERHAILLGHGWPPTGSSPHHQQNAKPLASDLIQHYRAFREIGRVERTLFLLRFIADAETRRTIRAETTKIEAFNDFLDWVSFGGPVIKSGDPVEQEKQLKYASLVANAVMLSNVADMTTALSAMDGDGHPVTPALVGCLSPYTREHIRRFGQYVLDMADVPPPLDPQPLPFEKA